MAGLCQIIPDDAFSGSSSFEVDLSNLSGFPDRGLDYNIVSIFGPQSSGKSALLNHLFNANFAVMNPLQRQQTTKGVWLAYDSGKRALVMDVEGTDSAERGEEHMNWESKLALFSLALSDVLIVNMWTHDVGRQKASNYGTLRVLFEMNLELFYTQQEQSPKTLLLFIFRDYMEETPLEELKKTLLRDIQNIWSKIHKPDELDIKDLFDFEFTSLPDKRRDPHPFEQAVQALAERFQTSPARPVVAGPAGAQAALQDSCFFKAAYHKRIPAEAVSEYASIVLAKINSNEKLMLQQEREAMHQKLCEDIAHKAMAKFERELEGVTAQLEKGAVVDLVGKRICEQRAAALDMYNEQASHYLERVYLARREQLVGDMDKSATERKNRQVENLLCHNREGMDDTLDSLTKILRAGQRSGLEKVDEYVDVSSKTLQPAIQDLDLGDSAWQEFKARLRDQAVEVARQRCEKEITQVGDTMYKRFETEFLCDNGSKRVWHADSDPEGIRKQALGKAATLLDVLEETMAGLHGSATLLAGEHRQELLDKLSRDVDAHVDLAKMVQAQAKEKKQAEEKRIRAEAKQKQEEAERKKEDYARNVGTTVGLGVGATTVGGVGAAVFGTSAATMSATLTAWGAMFGGGMAYGIVVASAGPVAVAAASGYAAYKVVSVF